MSENRKTKRIGLPGVFLLAVALISMAVAANTAIGKPGMGKNYCGGHNDSHWGFWDDNDEMTEEEMQFASKIILKIFSRYVRATDEQTDALRQQVGPLIPQMMMVGNKNKDLHKKLSAAMNEENLDKEKLEDVRQQALTMVNEASGLMLDTVVLTSGILTPEQRKELRDDLKSMHEMKRH